MGGRLIEAFETASAKDADDMVLNLVMYAGSRTATPHHIVKASDISSL